MEDQTVELLSLERNIRLTHQEILSQTIELQKERILGLENQILELKRILQYRLSHTFIKSTKEEREV